MQGLIDYVRAGLVSHKDLVERLIIGILVGGHLLVEGPPGLAKTRAIKRLASGLEGSFSRIQCTPDLMPADMTGTEIFRPDTGKFEFVPGPVFHELVLVDEINRAPPKVQSALLEAMAEGHVTVGGKTYPLPDLFIVMATQNSIEHEGTFPLPEAQIDRFLMHVLVELPDATAEMSILDMVELEAKEGIEAPPTKLAVADIMQARNQVREVHLSLAIKDFIVRLVMATRDAEAAPLVREAIEHPVSPRGTLALSAAARARAMLKGRDFVIPEDVVALAPDVLAHRIILTWRAASNGETTRGLVAKLLEAVSPL